MLAYSQGVGSVAVASPTAGNENAYTCSQSPCAATSKDKTSTSIPQLYSMKDLILQQFKEPLCEALCLWLRYTGSPASHPNTFSIVDVSFWREDRSAFTARIRMRINVDEGDDAIRRDFWATVDFDFDDGVHYRPTTISDEISDPPAGWLLNDYLIPVLRKEAIDAGAETMLRTYLPEAYIDPQTNIAFVLAERMGLQVVRLPLYEQNKTRSILFFCAGAVTIQDEDQSLEELVPAKTIVLNTNAALGDHCQMDVYHECIHYDWHYMFHRLQQMCSNAPHPIKPTKPRSYKSQLEWMEWQAMRGGYGLMMPRSVMASCVRKELGALSGVQQHEGKRLDRVARTVAQKLHLPKYRIRTRMIQIGFYATKGALNFVDGRYIEPFAFSHDNDSCRYTFVVDRQSAFDEYCRNTVFREQIDSGRYVFVDGHLCMNDPKFVCQTQLGLRLTAWANAHVDKCCMRFVSVYEPNEPSAYRLGTLHSDEEYNSHYLTFPDGEQSTAQGNRFDRMVEIQNQLPDTFHEALEYLMVKQNITLEQLEERSKLSTRTITRLRTEERLEHSIDQVIALCVALKLPPWLSNEMLSLAGFAFRRIPLHQAFRFVLDCMFMDTVEDVQRFLMSKGFPPLKLKLMV